MRIVQLASHKLIPKSESHAYNHENLAINILLPVQHCHCSKMSLVIYILPSLISKIYWSSKRNETNDDAVISFFHFSSVSSHRDCNSTASSCILSAMHRPDLRSKMPVKSQKTGQKSESYYSRNKVEELPQVKEGGYWKELPRVKNAPKI